MDVKEWLGSDNQLGIDIWTKKYQHNNETFDEWLNRISGGVGAYKDLIIKKQFLPGGRILANRGLKGEQKITYSNCYVIPAPQDSIESIFDTAKMMARTFSYGGGVGIDISNLSPNGAHIRNAAKTTSGAISFMDLYSLVTGLIGQSGRRGALMISIDCHHPDVEHFVELKSDLDKVTKANLSVRVTTDFMDAVEKDLDFKLTFTRDETGEVIEKTVKARELFHKLCEMNWDYAEPGILFWDRIKNWNLLSNNDEFAYAGVNPCAEEPLPAGGSCLLGSLNIDAFVKNGVFDLKGFQEAAGTATEFLNDVLDEGLSLHPLDIQQKTVADWRQIGLGIMGLADALIHLKITYGSPEAIDFINTIGRTLINAALCRSALLAQTRGAYAKYDNRVVDTPFFKAVATKETERMVSKIGLRNSQLLTCAPTGTISTMLGISGGIEPIFANYYVRKTKSLHGHDEDYKVYTPIVKKYMEEHGITDDKMLPSYFVTSADITPYNRVKMQAALQTYVDASISSTVNLPNSATIEDVSDVYFNAYKQGLKGITVYRAGCKREGILVTDTDAKKSENDYGWGEVRKVDSDLIGIKKKMVNGCGKFHLQLFYDPDTKRPWETFISLGDGGGCERNLEFVSKLMSKCLRAGVPMEEIIETAKSVRPCPSYVRCTLQKGGTSRGTSCPNSIGFALEEFMERIKQEQVVCAPEVAQQVKEDNHTVCPECGGEMVHEGGCDICRECGYSHCG